MEQSAAQKNYTTMDVIFNTNIYTRQPALFTIRNWSSGSAFLHIVFWRTEEEKACECWYALPMSDTSFTVNLIEVFRALLAEGVNFFEMDYETYGEDKVTIYDTGYKIWQYAGTIDPATIKRPIVCRKQPQPDYWTAVNNVFYVWCPEYMIKGESLARVMFENWGRDFSEEPSETLYFGLTINGDDIEVHTKNYEIAQANEARVEYILSHDVKPVYFTPMQPQDQNKTYAAVEWVSSFGVLRRHIFEVIKQTNNANDVVSLETVGNGWDEHKGQLFGCTLRLENLNRYDYWYYADLILSDDVKVSFDGANYYKVQVTAKGYTLPDGEAGKLSTLEIPINYERYDTI